MKKSWSQKPSQSQAGAKCLQWFYFHNWHILVLIISLHRSDEEERERGSSVGQKQHLGFWPTVVTVPSLSSVTIQDLFADNVWPRLRVHPGQAGVEAAVVPPAASVQPWTVFLLVSILVPVPGQRWVRFSLVFSCPEQLNRWPCPLLGRSVCYH